MKIDVTAVKHCNQKIRELHSDCRNTLAAGPLPFFIDRRNSGSVHTTPSGTGMFQTGFRDTKKVRSMGEKTDIASLLPCLRRLQSLHYTFLPLQGLFAYPDLIKTTGSSCFLDRGSLREPMEKGF